MDDSMLSLWFVLLLLTPTLLGAFYPYTKKQKVARPRANAHPSAKQPSD